MKNLCCLLMCLLLLAACAKRTPLVQAAIDDDINKVRKLLAKGAAPSEPDVTGTTALHYAAYNNNPEMAQVLIDAGADIDYVDKSGAWPLMISIHDGNIDVMRVLLEAGADVGTPGSGTAALHYAAQWNQPAAIELLVEYGAEVNAASELGRTPLQIAEEEGSADAAAKLRELGGTNEPISRSAVD